MARYARSRPTEHTALKTINNRAKGGFVLHKKSAKFFFNRWGDEMYCTLPNKCVIVLKASRKPYYVVTAYLTHSNPDELSPKQRKWIGTSVTGKNYMQAIARLFGALKWLWNPIEKCWMNYYDVCEPHIVFYKNPEPKKTIEIPTQSSINKAALVAESMNTRLLIF